uniref:site-specific DNA-methyltransferase (adenine-specific) n=1 Tax=Thermodesulfobacterium geofontis TaxID=1295609 RepID=A0A7V5XFH3_9BACT
MVDPLAKQASPQKETQFLIFQISLKGVFLQNLRGGKLKYKRYLGSPLRYAGGKSWAVGYIVEHIPENIKRLVSPFFGGGSLEIAVNKGLGIPVLGFDIFDILVNYWQIQITSPLELYQELKKLSPNKETYKKVKEELRKHWLGEKKLPLLKLAAYYFFNHNLSYGPGFLGWMSSVYAKEDTYRRMIEKVKNFKVKNLWVECADFRDVLLEFKNDFLYCDPPYYLGDDSILFRGLYPQRNFPIHHNDFPHELLRDLLYDHKGGFALSYNDSPTIRKWYKDFEIIELPVHYTMGQGELRIGKNRKKKNMNHVKKCVELLIVKRR